MRFPFLRLAVVVDWFMKEKYYIILSPSVLIGKSVLHVRRTGHVLVYLLQFTLNCMLACLIDFFLSCLRDDKLKSMWLGFSVIETYINKHTKHGSGLYKYENAVILSLMKRLRVFPTVVGGK